MSEAAQQGLALPFRAIEGAAGVVQIFMNSFRSEAEFDAVGYAVAEYLLARHAGERGVLEFAYHPGRRISEVRFVPESRP